MNEAFHLLFDELQYGGSVISSELIDALYVIRAHRSLTAIIPAARHFIDLCAEHPGLNRLPDISHYTQRLRVLRRIAEIESADANLMGHALSEYDPGTPLRPLTGDSGITDILLIDSADDAARSAQFEHLLAWFIWQVQRYHLKTCLFDTYRDYLLKPGTHRLIQGDGNRIYNAFLLMRLLADPVSRDRLLAFQQLNLEMTAKSSQKHTLTARFQQLQSRKSRARLLGFAESVLGFTEEELAAVQQRQTVIPRQWSLLLTTIWLPYVTEENSNAGGSGGSSKGRDLYRPKVRTSRYIADVTQRLDEDGVHGGTVIDVYFKDPAKKRDKDDADREDDDPDINEKTEPDVSLYLGDSKDLLKSYYAARGMQAAIEYGNAMLAWSNTTLSQSAISELYQLTQHDPREPALRRMGRLAIGLSLLSGRDLKDTAAPIVTQALGGGSIYIDYEKHHLVITAAKPKLTGRPLLTDCCHSRGLTIRLPLPHHWIALIQSLANSEPRRPSNVVKAAQELLTSLAPELSVTEKGLRQALPRALAITTRGDLGIRKVITDEQSLNLNNLIHYASYDVRGIEKYWHDAAAMLVGTLPDLLASQDPVRRVGAVHAFDLDKLNQHFSNIRSRLEHAQVHQDWIRAYNLLTLYLSLWLGLATAGRKSKKPVPQIILARQWAVVRDKSRSDGSTDRLVPLSPSLLEQIEAYLAFTSSVALVYPGLEPLVKTEQGFELRLQYLTAAGEITEYRPKYQEITEDITQLPGNWGRKLVRSEARELSGRFVDAGLGHWVRGRHPWRQTSTFNPNKFKRAWLSMQRRLETELGFTPIKITGIENTRRKLPLQPNLNKKMGPSRAAKSASKPIPYTLDQADEILKSTDPGWYNLVFNKEKPLPALALDLVYKALKNDRLAGGDSQAALADALCRRVWTQTKIPLFGMRPRPQFSRDWVIETNALQTLAYIEEVVLPKFRQDLEQLPARDTNDSGKNVELGRLIMIGIWRLGLTRWPLIDAWLKYMSRNTTLLGTGELRYLTIKVPNQKTREPMRRTLLLDDFSAAYWIIEGQYMATELEALYTQTGARRRGQADRSLKHYLNILGAGKKRISLTAMGDAAGQWIMLNAAPLLSAYAGGHLFTEDIDDPVLRRLNGLSPVRQAYESADAGRVVEDEEYSPSPMDIPKDLTRHSSHSLAHLISHKSPYPREWRRLAKRYKTQSRVEGLLRAYAVWLLERIIEQDTTGRFTPRTKGHYINRVQIVAHALFGFAQATPEWSVINEDNLEALSELSSDYFHQRAHHGAWYRFHAFLRDKSADHAGFEIGRLGHNYEHAVSAMILSAAEQEEVLEILPSALSGIGNPDLRTSAARHFDLLANFGIRRAEGEKLRSVDVQGDLMRIQAYGKHTLKTAWSGRVVPLEYALKPTRDWLENVVRAGHTCVIDPDPDTRSDGNNFFPAMNRIIKEVTGDTNLGSHHLRHTVASRVVLSLLADTVDLPGVFEDMPWVQDWLISPERIAVLLGGEGDGGQGMQALSAMLGHSHPTTTARHYVHTLCIALFAALRSADTISMERSFENRIASRATMQRKAKKAREMSASITEPKAKRHRINRIIRDEIMAIQKKGVHIDETPIHRHVPTMVEAPVSGPASNLNISFDSLEAIDRSLRDNLDLAAPEVLQIVRSNLDKIARIPTGKKGSTARRHPLECQANGVYLPARIAAGTATKAAVDLCEWLEMLREHHPVELSWLLDKWLNASESERGRMRLGDQEEVERASALPRHEYVRIDVEGAAVSSKRRTKKTKPVLRMRLRCIDVKGKKVTRDTGTVRWVMTHVAARLADEAGFTIGEPR